MRIVRLLLMIGALIGLFGQVHARARLPQPVALAQAMPDDCAQEMDGMEPPSDLLGEAAITEAQERQPCNGDLLDCISIKGWAVSALAGDDVQLTTPIAAPALIPAGHPLDTAPYRLFGRTIDPPRS